MDPILVIDTATTRAVLAVGLLDGTVLGASDWVAGYRHGEELLARLQSLLDEAGLRPVELGGIVVGTGPGAFTGLRVGIATAKGLAHALRVPLVGVSTGEALLEAATLADAGVAGPGSGGAASARHRPASRAGARSTGAGDGHPDPGRAAAGARAYVLLQPAGPADRVVTRRGAPPRILPGGEEPDLARHEVLVAVDLAGRAAGDSVTLGDRARDGLAAAMLRHGTVRLAAGEADDLALLVPEYVTLPRGVRGRSPDDAVAVTGRASP